MSSDSSEWYCTDKHNPSGLFRWILKYQYPQFRSKTNNTQYKQRVEGLDKRINATARIIPKPDVTKVRIDPHVSGTDLNDHDALSPTFEWQFTFLQGEASFSGVFNCWICYEVVGLVDEDAFLLQKPWEISLTSEQITVVGLSIVRYLMPESYTTRTFVALMFTQAVRLKSYSDEVVLTLTIKPKFGYNNFTLRTYVSALFEYDFVSLVS